MAAYNGHTETVKLLLDRGVNIEAADKVNEMLSAYHVITITIIQVTIVSQ